MALCGLFDRIVTTWAALQAKIHGQYSVSRLIAFKSYKIRSSASEQIGVLLLSVAPCVVMMLLIDLPQLSRPSDGLATSHVLWLRAFASSGLIAFVILQQMRALIPDLNICHNQIVLVTAVVAGTSTSWIWLLASIIGYPVPFTFAAGSPMFMTSLIACICIIWGKTFYHSRHLQQQLRQFILVVIVQWTLTIIYPIFNFVFLQVDAVGQILLALVFPLVKSFMKYWLAGLLEDLSDLRPELLIFNVDVFHALFTACCMQNAISVWTNVIIMVLDALRASISIRGVHRRLHRLYKRDDEDINMACSPICHPPLVDSAIHLLRCPGVLEAVEGTSGFNSVRVNRVASRNTRGLHIASVLPSPAAPPKAPSDAEISPQPALTSLSKLPVSLTSTQVDFLDKMNPSQQVSFVQDVLSLLHTTEFLLLAEYVEVIIPVMYCVYLVVVYHLPNRVYYPQLRSMDDERLTQVIQNVLLYAGLEFLSGIAMHWVLYGQVQFRPVQQLAFVLQMQWHTVQAKLVLWLVYMVQASLVHFGADYTFQFKWLHNTTYFD